MLIDRPKILIQELVYLINCYIVRNTSGLKQWSIIRLYVVGGFLIGLIFPGAALIISYLFLSERTSPTIISLHQEYHLLYIIDSAPFVLALASFFVGSNISKHSEKHYNKIAEKNKELERLNTDKEVLLKEIHHRVKNNLQVIMSLLSLQASFIDDEKSKSLIRYSQYRISSMAMIHDMLYRSSDLAFINYRKYTKELIENILSSMKGKNNGVDLSIEVDDVHLNIDTALPLGLLINEIVTNAFKYGIPGDKKGHFYLSLKRQGFNQYLLKAGDDGPGFPDDINFRSTNSLGLVLIHKLAIQLNGNIEKDNMKKGTHYILAFNELDN